MVELSNKTVVVVGVTGQVATPLAKTLAKSARVIGAARFSNPERKAELEAAGIECVSIDLESGDVASIPSDVDFVVNFAVAKTNDWTRDLDANVGGVLSLMGQVSGATAFLHCSSTAVYKPMGHYVFDEDGPLGDNHGVWEFLRTYSTAKIASEAAVRWAANRHNLPTTIVNWGGSTPVSVEEWCSYLGELTGLRPQFAPTEHTIDSVMVDLTRLHALVGETSVPWREGMAAMVAARHPELLSS